MSRHTAFRNRGRCGGVETGGGSNAVCGAAFSELLNDLQPEFGRQIPAIQKRPVHSSSAFAIRAMTSDVHRINHDTLDSRARSSASTFASAIRDLRSVSAGSAGEPSLLRREGNRFHHRRATSSSDHVFTTSGRFLRKQSGVPTDEGG